MPLARGPVHPLAEPLVAGVEVEAAEQRRPQDRVVVELLDFLRSQAQAIVAADFFETRTLTGARLTILAAIEHTPHAASGSSAQPPTPPRSGSPKSDATSPWTSRTPTYARST